MWWPAGDAASPSTGIDRKTSLRRFEGSNGAILLKNSILCAFCGVTGYFPGHVYVVKSLMFITGSSEGRAQSGACCTEQEFFNTIGGKPSFVPPAIG
jgi:hypothetical protein